MLDLNPPIPVRDATHRTEAATYHNGEKSWESVQISRLLFEQAPGGMYVVGLDGRWLQVNPALCQLLGRNVAEMQATTCQAITHPDDLPRNMDGLRDLLSGRTLHYQAEKRYLHKSGLYLPVLLSAGLFRDRRAKPLYYVGHILDRRPRTTEYSLARA